MNDHFSSPLIPKYLAMHQCQGRSNDCGPYSLAIVLNAILGTTLDGNRVADEMDKPIWRLPFPIFRRIPHGATFPWGLVDIFQRHGLVARWRFFSSSAELIKGLERGEALILILATWRPVWIHIMTLAAYDPEKGWGFVNTAYPEHELYWLPDGEFRYKWGNIGRMVVFARLA